MVTATPTSPTIDLDALFAALGNPTRRSIVSRLSTGDATISELAAPFAMTLPAVSKHILVLADAGIIERKRSGRTTHCILRPEALRAAESWMAETRRFWTDTLDSLAKFVETAADDSTTEVER